jgi:hypothetical protein
MAVHQQNRGAVPAMTDPQAHFTDVNEVEPTAIEHAAIIASPRVPGPAPALFQAAAYPEAVAAAAGVALFVRSGRAGR